MKQILLTVFVILLTGCSTTDKLSRTENLPLVTKSHTTINHLVIDSVGEDANTDIVDREDVFTVDGLSDIELENIQMPSLKYVSAQLYETGASISSIWNENFIPMYTEYNYNLLEIDEAAEMITDLNERYSELETEISKISIPTELADKEREHLSKMKEDLLLAISNRTLAILEFKSMIANKKEEHKAFMDVHISNSDRYIKHVEEVNNELQSSDDSLVTSSE